MKLDREIKKAIYKKLGLWLEDNLTEMEFNQVLNLTKVLNTQSKTVPYGLFDDIGVMVEHNVNIVNSESFIELIQKSVDNIESGFNKARKLVRYFKQLSKEELVVFNRHLDVTDLAALCLIFTSIFSDTDLESFGLSKEKQSETLTIIANYLLCILLVDTWDIRANKELILASIICSESELIKFILAYKYEESV